MSTITKQTDWIQTYSGKAFYPLEPDIESIDIIDIAHSLSMQCRYTGHCKKFYSVAEHCVLLSYAVPRWLNEKKWALMHDATEAYLTDVPRPIKPFLFGYKEAEDELMKVIAKKFDLSLSMPKIVKEYDYLITHNERAALMNPSDVQWNLVGEPIEGVTIKCWNPKEAGQMFLQRFEELFYDAA